jgi:RimJ/RimL family protein N-acetyltransferase
MKRMNDELTAAWPLYGLELRCDDLLLRPAGDDCAALGRVVFNLLEPDEHHFLPHWAQMRSDTIEATARNVLRWSWQQRFELTGDNWYIPFAVVRDRQVLGLQSGSAEMFSVRRDVHTESCLDSDARQSGVGGRMRAMIIEFAFAHLGALTVSSGCTLGNEASKRVSGKLGYIDDGTYIDAVNGQRHVGHRPRLSRERWAQFRPDWLDDLDVTGLGPVLELFGHDSAG